jgi:hypothetical protein
LARWLVDPSHPLTGRVTVNRFWQQHFGAGIVESGDDFGARGGRPSHPQLLDWLARTFVDGGWDMKGLHRLIVTSATYRQSSRLTGESLQRDPENRLLSRGPRFRMDAEMIRDTALASSDLLVERVGGPSVKPYQPDGLWEAVAYPASTTARYQQGHGADLYRRSVYTFWKRTSPPPAMQIFDAPSREYCTVGRIRTNTPSAALVLMNDVQFVEAARRLAERAIQEAGPTVDDRIRYAFRLTTGRLPTDREREVLHGMYVEYGTAYREHPDLAAKLVGVGESPRDERIEIAELAAWTMIAHTLLNLDETINQG